MSTRLLAVIATTAVLALPAAALPAGPAQAKVDCTPSIDQSSIDFTPATVAVTSKGYRTVQFSAAFTAPCAEDNGSDLNATVIFSSPDIDGTSLLEASDGIYPSTDPHSFGVFALDHILSGDLRNSWAGEWTTEFIVTDQNDDPVHSYDAQSGPTIWVLRAAKLTANASPEPVKKGKTVTVTGKLTRANWNTGKDGAYAHKSVELQFKPKGGSYAAVKTVTSSSKGKVSAKVAATKDGYFRFVYAGNSTTGSVKSAGDLIDVK